MKGVILFFMASTCILNDKFSSIYMPKIFVYSTLSIKFPLKDTFSELSVKVS